VDFADESYARQYTRKTETNRELGWEGRAVMHAMLGEFDRSGRFGFRRDPVRGIAAVTEIPVDIVRVALERLLETETWRIEGNHVVWPTYEEAQTCRKSDRLRKQASRGHLPSPPVTSGHPESPPSPLVTLSLAQPSLTQPSLALPESARVVEPIHNGPGTRRPGWSSFPKGWRWSTETEQAAAMVGVTPAQLQEHVDFWTLRDFSGGAVNDLDGELRRVIGDIRKRAEVQQAKAKRLAASAGPRSYGSAPSTPWEPTSRHRAYAAKHKLDIEALAREFRLAEVPERRTLHSCNEEFGRRMSLVAKGGTMGLEAVL